MGEIKLRENKIKEIKSTIPVEIILYLTHLMNIFNNYNILLI